MEKVWNQNTQEIYRRTTRLSRLRYVTIINTCFAFILYYKVLIKCWWKILYSTLTSIFIFFAQNSSIMKIIELNEIKMKQNKTLFYITIVNVNWKAFTPEYTGEIRTKDKELQTTWSAFRYVTSSQINRAHSFCIKQSPKLNINFVIHWTEIKKEIFKYIDFGFY